MRTRSRPNPPHPHCAVCLVSCDWATPELEAEDRRPKHAQSSCVCTVSPEKVTGNLAYHLESGLSRVCTVWSSAEHPSGHTGH